MNPVFFILLATPQAPVAPPSPPMRRPILPSIEDPIKTDWLITQLSNPDFNIFLSTRWKIRKLDKWPRQAIVQALQSNNTHARLHALLLWREKGLALPVHEEVSEFDKDAVSWILNPYDTVWDLLINHLRDDDIPHNYSLAQWACATFYPYLKPRLLEALYSKDVQQRSSAACLLIWKDFHEINFALPAIIQEFSWTNWNRNYLVHHADSFRYELEVMLWSSDRNENILAAYVYAMRGWNQYCERVVGMLAPELVDDDCRDNAWLASKALYAYGELGLPFLDIHDPQDEQQRDYLALIKLDILSPPTNLHELRRRWKTLPGIPLQELYYDPVMQATPYCYRPWDHQPGECPCSNCSSSECWDSCWE